MSVDAHRRAVNVADTAVGLLAHLLPSAPRDGRDVALAELEDIDTDRVRALATAAVAVSEVGDLLHSWQDQRDRDRAFASAIDEVLDTPVVLDDARARLRAIAHALRVADDVPASWAPSEPS